MPRLVPLARIVRPHGRRGEVKALLLGDGAPLKALSDCYLENPPGGVRRPCRITGCRVQGPAAILALEGVGSIAEAERLAGWLLAAPAGALAPLPQGTFYVSALAGSRVVTEEGDLVGELVGLEEGPGQDLWVVRAGGKEHLIPAVGEIVRRVDLAARRITIRPPAGLLELG